MSVRMPSNFGGSREPGEGPEVLGLEILAEKAASLGRAGERVEAALARLRENEGADRAALLKNGGRGGARLFHPAGIVRFAEARLGYPRI